MLLYILWEVKSQVYRIWPHFKTPPTTFFDWSCRSEGISFFAEQNEQVQYSAHLQAFKTISKTNTERTLPNKNEQKTNGANSISTAFEALCSVVRRGSGYTPALMLTLAPRCPVRRFREAARVTCRRKQGGHKSAHSARVTVTLKTTQAKAFQSVGDGSDGKTAQGRLPSPVSLWTAFDRSCAAQTL